MNENNKFPEGFNPIEEAEKLINNPSKKTRVILETETDSIKENTEKIPEKITARNAGVLNKVLKETYKPKTVNDQIGKNIDRYV